MADFDEILKAITENQDIMSKISEISKKPNGDVADRLPDIINVISPLINSEKKSEQDIHLSEKTDTPAAKIENSGVNSFGNSSFPIGKIGEKITRNSKLLLALKPYLNKNRCDVVDSIIKMAQVADLMKLMK